MVKFSDLLSFDGVCDVPVCVGHFVIWRRSGCCDRVSASLHSLQEVCSYCSAWSFSSDFVESVSFWCGGVLVARCSAGLLFGVRAFVLP